MPGPRVPLISSVAWGREARLVGEDDELSAVASVELGHRAVDVGFGCQWADHHAPGDLVIGESLCDQGDGLAFAIGQFGQAVIGALALARAAGRIGNGTGKRGAVTALVAGLAVMIVGGVVVAAAEGGPGTGYGIVGGVLALIVGLMAIILGGLALVRSRRTA